MLSLCDSELIPHQRHCVLRCDILFCARKVNVLGSLTDCSCSCMHVFACVLACICACKEECPGVLCYEVLSKILLPCFVGSEGWFVVLWCVVERTLLGRSRICVQGALGQASAQARLHRRRLDACRLECPLSSTGGGVLLHAGYGETRYQPTTRRDAWA